jgi:hypothetical protein
VALTANASRATKACLRAGWQAGRFVPLASAATAQELVRVLAYPRFKLGAGEQQDLLADYLPWVQVVRIPIRRPQRRPAAIRSICRFCTWLSRAQRIRSFRATRTCWLLRARAGYVQCSASRRSAGSCRWSESLRLDGVSFPMPLLTKA